MIVQSVPERSGKSVKIQNKENLKVILLVCRKMLNKNTFQNTTTKIKKS